MNRSTWGVKKGIFGVNFLNNCLESICKSISMGKWQGGEKKGHKGYFMQIMTKNNFDGQLRYIIKGMVRHEMEESSRNKLCFPHLKCKFIFMRL